MIKNRVKCKRVFLLSEFHATKECGFVFSKCCYKKIRMKIFHTKSFRMKLKRIFFAARISRDEKTRIYFFSKCCSKENSHEIFSHEMFPRETQAHFSFCKNFTR